MNKSIFNIVAVLLILGIAVQVFTACFSDDDDDEIEGTSSSSKPSSSSAGTGKNSSSSSITVIKGTFKDDRDGKTYKSVKIGEQVWMAENLNYEIGGNCYHDDTYPDEAANCEEYGKLYEWATAMQVCPSGWHLPSEAEWGILVAAVGGKDMAGEYLKDTMSTIYGSRDSYGFTARLGGYRQDHRAAYGSIVYAGYWWSSTMYDAIKVHALYMPGLKTEAEMVKMDKYYALSVRCLQGPSDVSSSSIARGSFTDERDGEVYEWVKIGTQKWIAKNMNYTTQYGKSKCFGEDGIVRSKNSENNITLSDDEIKTNCNRYGRLYNWTGAMSACPTGWHLPNNDEWTTLSESAGGKKFAGTELKATSGWNLHITVLHPGADTYGFAALPGGSAFDGGSAFAFEKLGERGEWWSASQRNEASAYTWYMEDGSRAVGGGELPSTKETRLYSIRCLQD